MVLARLQVRMTFLSPRWFIASTFFRSLGSTKGPFFSERDMSTPVAGRACGRASSYSLTTLLPAPLDNHGIRYLVGPRLCAQCRLAPRAARPRLADGLAAFAAAV